MPIVRLNNRDNTVLTIVAHAEVALKAMTTIKAVVV